jgi:hypothetical protein
MALAAARKLAEADQRPLSMYLRLLLTKAIETAER